MGVPLGYYTPWELYMVAVPVAQKLAKNRSLQGWMGYLRDTIPVGIVNGGCACGGEIDQK